MKISKQCILYGDDKTGFALIKTEKKISYFKIIKFLE